MPVADTSVRRGKIRNSPTTISVIHPANRFELAKGRDLIVDPAPATGPINFLVYPLLEVDGKSVKAETSFAFRRTHA